MRWKGSIRLTMPGIVSSLALAAAVVMAPGVEAAPAKKEAAKGPVKVGYLTPLSGVYAGPGADQRDGFLLYLEQAGNKVGERPIEVLVEDKGSNKPDEALTKARKLVERDKVHILAGIISSGVAYALRDFVNAQKVPFVVTNAGADGLTQKQRSPYIFRSAFANSDSSHPLGEWAYKQGYRKAVILAADYSAGYEQIGGFVRTFTEAGGQIVQEIYPPLGTTDYAPYLAQIKRDADVVSVFFAGADALRFVQQYGEYGLKGAIPLIGKGYLVDEVILPKQGDAAVGIVTALHWSYSLNTPENKAFIQAYEAKYKRPPTSYAEQGYVGAQMLAKALEAVKGNIENKQPFLNALKKVELNAPRGMFRLDSYGNPVHNIYIRKVEKVGGKLQNTVIDTYPSVSQFWKWNPNKFMAMPDYDQMKGKWVK